ncbi:MAG: hypothetical protein ACE14L_09500 [Terriglobales bacterium]
MSVSTSTASASLSASSHRSGPTSSSVRPANQEVTPAGAARRKPALFCEHCSSHTQFLHISEAIELVGVSRSTIYYWMDRSWIHWKVLPSGRRLICAQSLVRHPARTA